MGYSIPIEFPPGRHGLTPELTLTYKSNSGNGWLGMGWDIGIESIERQTRFGINYNGDNYVYRKNSNAVPLVNIGGGQYRAQFENDFIQFQKIPLSDGTFYWMATDKKGTKHLFGETTYSRLDNPATVLPATQIFSWNLDQIVDLHGNTIVYNYQKDVYGSIYPSSIDYQNTHIALNLTFISGAPFSYLLNFPTSVTFGLSDITIYANWNSTRTVFKSYLFSYCGSGSTGRTLLCGITEKGSDGSSLNQSFNYQNGGLSWQGGGPPTWNGGPQVSTATTLTDQCVEGDFNGDGAQDIACYTYNVGTWNIALGSRNGLAQGWSDSNWNGGPVPPDYLGNGTPLVSGECFTGDFDGNGTTDIACYQFDSQATWQMGLSKNGGFQTVGWSNGPSTAYPTNGQCFSGDFNGDGKTDIACYTNSGGDWVMGLSTGTGWNRVTWHNGQVLPNTATNPIVNACFPGDFNGDGLTDLACFIYSSQTWSISLSQSNGWNTSIWSTGDMSNWTINGNTFYSNLTPAPGSCVTGDFNGDGKTDIACLPLYSTKQGYGVLLVWAVLYSNGSGWGGISFNSSPVSIPYVAGSSPYLNCLSGDFNGDGRIDIGCYQGGAGANWQIALWENKFVYGGAWAGPQTDVPGNKCFVGDFNGDGKSDVACNLGGGAWSMGLSTGPAPDLLSSITNEWGGTTSINYLPSNSISFSNPSLPFSLPLLSSLSRNDGNGNVSTEYFTYAGGSYYPPERDFRGFNDVKETGPVDSGHGQRVIETWYHQGNDIQVDSNNPNVATGFMKGKPYRKRISDGSGNIYTEQTTLYQTSAGPSYFNPPSQVDSYTCDGTPAPCNGVHTEAVYGYDSYGNVILEQNYGDLSTTLDDKTITRVFTSNINSWIVGLPTSEIVYQGIGVGKQIARTDYYYDGVTSCNNLANSQNPTMGDLTRVVKWLSGGSSPDIRMAYDWYGNLTCRRDEDGNITSFTYDTNFTFPTVKTDPLGHQTTTQYYGVNGISADTGLYGQIKSLTDPNQATITTQYDGLGRKIKVIEPTGGVTTYAYRNFGTPVSQNIFKTDPSGQSVTDYFDGFGRNILEQKTGPASQTINKKTAYNLYGSVSTSSLPEFVPNTLFKSFFYDTMDRPIQIQNQDGTTKYFCYQNWVSVSLDEKKSRLRNIYDSFGNLLEVDEYLGSYSLPCSTGIATPYASTTYSYDLLGHLTGIIDAKGNRTTYQYDTLGRKTFMQDPDAGAWNYAYDYAGNLTRQIDANGNELVFTYDPLNRVKTKSTSVTALPTSPTQLTAIAANTAQILLSWTGSLDNVAISSYSVERCLGVPCGSSFSQIGSSTTTTYTDTRLSIGTSYSYRVKSIDVINRQSSYSNTATATSANAVPPTTPANLMATASGNAQIALNWTASVDSTGVPGYNILRCQGPACANFVQFATSATTSYTDAGLSIGTSYSYQVQATDSIGLSSAYSNLVSAIPVDTLPPTIPVNLTISSLTNSQIALVWDASIDNVGVAGYLVERCQGLGCSTFSQIGTIAGYPYVDTTINTLVLVSESYRIRATDAAGNLSGYSNIVTTGPWLNSSEFNIAGSSAAAPFLNQIMPSMFSGAQLTHYVNGAISSPAITTGNLDVWVVPSVWVIRIAATNSLDGIARLQCQALNSVPTGYYSPNGACATDPGQPTSPTYGAFSSYGISDDANAYYLDYTNPAGCGTPITKVANTASGPVQYTEISGCTGIVKLPVYLGVSDINPTSFGQTGPTTTSVMSLNSGSLTMSPEAIVPYQIVVGSQVTYANSVTPNLTRDQVTFLLNRPVTNWNLLPGYTSVNAQPYLCLAQAGSGVKALLQKRITLPFHEYTALGSTPNVSFGGTINDVMNCISTHPYSIGYIPADRVPNLTAGKGVTLDGLAPYEATAANPRRNVQNGLYDFWGVENFYYITNSNPWIGMNQTNLMNTIMNYANNPAIYPYIPAGKYWVPYSQMCVTRANSDTGYSVPLSSSYSGGICPIP